MNVKAILVTLGSSVLNLVTTTTIAITIMIYNNRNNKTLTTPEFSKETKNARKKILGPVIFFFASLEEFTWRFPIVTNNFFYGIPSMLHLAFTAYMKHKRSDEKYIGALTTSLIALPVITYIPYFYSKTTEYRNVGKILFIMCSSLSFGAVHAANFEKLTRNILHQSLLIQGVSSLYFTHLACNFGIGYSVLSHTLVNYILFCMKSLNKKNY